MRYKIIAAAVFAGLLFCGWTAKGYSQQVTNTPPMQTKQLDINNDGRHEVTYYHDGKQVTKAEADTNNDGKPDITVNTDNGKFKSAEADTNYDGKTEKKFTNPKDFNDWLNKENPKYKDSLGWRDDTAFGMMQF